MCNTLARILNREYERILLAKTHMVYIVYNIKHKVNGIVNIL